jgi:hypothetical protein
MGQRSKLSAVFDRRTYINPESPPFTAKTPPTRMYLPMPTACTLSLVPLSTARHTHKPCAAWHMQHAVPHTTLPPNINTQRTRMYLPLPTTCTLSLVPLSTKGDTMRQMAPNVMPPLTM